MKLGMSEGLEKRFRQIAPAVDFCSLRLVESKQQYLSVRRGVVQPVHTSDDAGAMLTVMHAGGLGYAATSDLSSEGLRRAAALAVDWSRLTATAGVAGVATPPQCAVRGEYVSAVKKPWNTVPLREKLDLLREQCERLKGDPCIVDRSAALWYGEEENLYLTTEGSRIHQVFKYILPQLKATANTKSESQTRTFGGHAWARQGGLEVLDDTRFYAAAPQVGEQAVELLHAPNCPAAACDLLLAPDQMILQLHESIGHPLELDRILGDERNYAGRSFVTPEMFGRYQYGSELLTVTFDPTRSEELASYAFDDDGQPARREYLIRQGLLLRGLGGFASQQRSRLPGVASSRASSWNRPPIDRMANLNMEPGQSSFDDLVRSVERGVFMQTNCSWSIDDSRNKFQFGCEWARLIEDGELGRVMPRGLGDVLAGSDGRGQRRDA
jgi:predicted Zn-dependent protease